MIDYALAKKQGAQIKAALTRAEKITEPRLRYKAVLAACKLAVKAWEKWGAWPDAWSRWQRALDDAYSAYSRSLTYTDITLRWPRLSTASKVAQHKREHPELYCPHVRCLWRTGGPLCKRHARALATGKPTEKVS